VNDNRKRRGDAFKRFEDRRIREEEAPRLRREVPTIATLVLELEGRKRDGVVALEPRHIRRFAVETAPALFIVPCGDPRCKDGGHDITHSVMVALRAARTRFEGDDECSGSQGQAACDRVMHYVGIATYA
jgi:hypothetical protein